MNELVEARMGDSKIALAKGSIGPPTDEAVRGSLSKTENVNVWLHHPEVLRFGI